MEIICIEDEAFFELIRRVITELGKKDSDKSDKWISGEEAMRMLRIASKTTLQKMRDDGKIRFSQPEKRIILYDVDSIYEYLEKNARNTF